MKNLALLLILAAFTCCKKDPLKPIIQEPQMLKIAVTADFAYVISKFDKKKVLNIASGGHGINTDLTWMPGFYDKLAEIGIDEFRIDRVLSDWFYQVVSRNGKGELQYNFSKLDKIILYCTELNNGYGKESGEGNLCVGGSYDVNLNASYVAKKMYISLEYINLKKICFCNFAESDQSLTFGA